MAAPGSSILLPSPGFPLYETICHRHGIVCRFYSLLPEQGWEADLSSIQRLTDGTTAAVLINNPSNPCGAVYSSEHLQEIVQCADELKLPIIADEVYAGMTFDKRFVPVAEVATGVPVFSVGALSKRWLVPGWRLGWVCVHDVNDNLHGSGCARPLTVFVRYLWDRVFLSKQPFPASCSTTIKSGWQTSWVL